jgi:hypothetical protein
VKLFNKWMSTHSFFRIPFSSFLFPPSFLK